MRVRTSLHPTKNESGQLAVVVPLIVAITLGSSLLWMWSSNLQKSASAGVSSSNLDQMANTVADRVDQLIYSMNAGQPPANSTCGQSGLVNVLLNPGTNSSTNPNTGGLINLDPSKVGNPADGTTTYQFTCNATGVLNGCPTKAQSGSASIRNCLVFDGSEATGIVSEIPSATTSYQNIQVTLATVGGSLVNSFANLTSLANLSTSLSVTVSVSNFVTDPVTGSMIVSPPQGVAPLTRTVQRVRRVNMATLGNYTLVLTDPPSGTSFPQISVPNTIKQVTVAGSVYSAMKDADTANNLLENIVDPTLTNLTITGPFDVRATAVPTNKPATALSLANMQNIFKGGFTLGVFGKYTVDELPIEDDGPYDQKIPGFSEAWDQRFYYNGNEGGVGLVAGMAVDLYQHVRSNNGILYLWPGDADGSKNVPLGQNSINSNTQWPPPAADFNSANGLAITNSDWTCSPSSANVAIVMREHADFQLTLSNPNTGNVSSFCGLIRAKTLTINLSSSAQYNLIVGKIIADQVVITGGNNLSELYIADPSYADDVPAYAVPQAAEFGGTPFSFSAISSAFAQFASGPAHNFFVPILQSIPLNSTVSPYPYYFAWRPIGPVANDPVANTDNCICNPPGVGVCSSTGPYSAQPGTLPFFTAGWVCYNSTADLLSGVPAYTLVTQPLTPSQQQIQMQVPGVTGILDMILYAH